MPCSVYLKTPFAYRRRGRLCSKPAVCSGRLPRWVAAPPPTLLSGAGLSTSPRGPRWASTRWCLYLEILTWPHLNDLESTKPTTKLIENSQSKTNKLSVFHLSMTTISNTKPMMKPTELLVPEQWKRPAKGNKIQSAICYLAIAWWWSLWQSGQSSPPQMNAAGLQQWLSVCLRGCSCLLDIPVTNHVKI